MRTSQEINAEIEKLQKTLRHKELEKYNLQQRIDKLRNTLSKAQHNEELEKDGVFVNIVEVKRIEDSVFAGYQITTDEGLTWLTHKKLKVGKHKVTRRFRDRTKEINEEYRNKK